MGNPGSASADMPVDRPYADYNYSRYTEDELGSTKGLPLAQQDRYEVEMHQFILQSPLPFTERADFGFEVVHEAMSGASPWYVVPDAAGSPIQVMSGATIEDTRLDLLANWNYYYDNARLGLSGGYSTENDYDGINLSVDGETHFNQGNTTLSTGLGLTYDQIEPTDAALFSTRPDDENKWTVSLSSGLAQILDRKSVLQTSLVYKHSHGYLSDPYKAVFVVGGAAFLPDSRPDTRNQLSWLTRYRHHVEELNGTLHFNYQFYIDDWDLTSHTIDLAWHQSLWNSVSLVPSLRYYTQGEADFYVPYYNISPGAGQEHSSDFRLSAYGSLTLGVKTEYVFRTRWTGNRQWRATVSAERYMSSADLSHTDPSTEAPGLVSFNVITLGFSVRY